MIFFWDIAYWALMIICAGTTAVIIIKFGIDRLFEIFIYSAVLATVFGLGSSYIKAKKAYYQNQQIIRERSIEENKSPEEKKLEAKMRELADLREKLQDKLKQVADDKVLYNDNINATVKELQKKKRQTGITSVSKALANQDINHALALLQKYYAYLNKLQEIEASLNGAIHDVQYMERDAAADLSILQTLGPQKVDELSRGIDSVMTKYLPETGKLAITIDPSDMPSKEQIWQEIQR